MSRITTDHWITLDQTESTNSILLEGDFLSGTMITARHQRAGRGRRGRVWNATDRSFLFSLLLEFDSLPSHAGFLPLLAGLCVLEAAESVLKDLHPVVARESLLSVKWPNDILLSREGRTGKLAGILLESRISKNSFRLVTGIGLNWSSAPQDEQSRFAPISLLPEELPQAKQPELFLGWLLESMNRRGYGEGMVRPEHADDLWNRFYLAGRKVRTRNGEGVVAGLDRDGALLIDGAAGSFRYDRTDEEYEIL